MTSLASQIQRQAADPSASVWVNASAGTGKTKVLTDRLIRLMLPRDDGRAGTPAHKILCLTFTKAGAGEMLNRVMSVLSDWAALPEDALAAKMEKDVLGHAPTPLQLREARKLFANVIDAPGGMNIMTIHAFCKSILGRFPLEAGLSPNFKQMSDSEAADMQRMARDKVLGDLAQNPETAHLVADFAEVQNAQDMSSRIGDLVSRRAALDAILARHGGIDAVIARVYALHGMAVSATPDELVAAALAAFDDAALYEISGWLSAGKSSDVQRADRLRDWLTLPARGRHAKWAMLFESFITSSSGNRKAATKGIAAFRPDLVNLCEDICVVLEALKAGLYDLETCRRTSMLLRVGVRVKDAYRDMKAQRHMLDYEDLILKTVALLDRSPDWVKFKLDGGLDHILVDEAQDTNAAQWIIVEKLVDDFFNGAGQTEDVERTLFVVGDEKQSIYRFQGADPQVFHERRRFFEDQVNRGAATWRDVPLNISFRSTESVLGLVDRVFDTDGMRAALTDSAAGVITHTAHRAGQAGHIELWPVVKGEKAERADEWTLPEITPMGADPKALLATRIASEIARWIDEGRVLPSRGRSVRAGDIMILVRNRDAMVEHLIRALKDNRVPVNGIDRMVLSQQIAVEDMVSAAQFALLPEDDLALAELLKSPFIGWDDDRLFAVAHKRRGSLWDAVRQSQDASVIAWLSALIRLCATKSAFGFFSALLTQGCPADSFSGLRALMQRLGQDCAEPVEEFMARVFEFDLSRRAQLQDFIQDFATREESIKRETEDHLDVVRIMTVHNSKGLQAPIVILPDTTRQPSDPKKLPSLLWPDGVDGMDVPLWHNKASEASAFFNAARDRFKQREIEESMRLLYVALTRAEDEVYVTGWQSASQKDLPEECWYCAVKAALDGMDGVAEYPEHAATLRDDAGKAAECVRGLTRAQDPSALTQKSKELISLTEATAHLPPAFFGPPAPEPQPPRPLQPSRPSQEDENELVALSPLLAAQGTRRFRRGVLIHALLQFLPDIAPDGRDKAAHTYLQRQEPEMEEAQRRALITEVFAITESDDYRPLFTPDTRAEVPITGLVRMEGSDGIKTQVISGQIDRLRITPDSVWVVDYKTNRPAPREARNIPRQYRRQMDCYRELLQAMYPGREIRCFLLWTDHARIMEVPREDR